MNLICKLFFAGRKMDGVTLSTKREQSENPYLNCWNAAKKLTLYIFGVGFCWLIICNTLIPRRKNMKFIWVYKYGS